MLLRLTTEKKQLRCKEGKQTLRISVFISFQQIMSLNSLL